MRLTVRPFHKKYKENIFCRWLPVKADRSIYSQIFLNEYFIIYKVKYCKKLIPWTLVRQNCKMYTENWV